MLKKLFVPCLALVLAAAYTGRAETELTKTEKARQIFEKNKNAVVRVQALISAETGGSGGSNSKEIEMQVSGIVVGADGLTIVPHYIADLYQQKRKLKTKFLDFTIFPTEGIGIKARAVLEDPELGLVFLKPLNKLDNIPSVLVVIRKSVDHNTNYKNRAD